MTLPFGQASNRPGFYSTKQEAPATAPTQQNNLPWLQNSQGEQPSQAPAQYVPFQRATPYGTQAVPSPLPMERSVPVENIDGIEVSEPAAPTETQLEANPAQEDPAAPTELTAPMFAANGDKKTPRELVLRVLNKVTARSEELRARPGETITFGKLVIEAVQCYQSAPSSQSDSVALLSLSEKVADAERPRLLFHGWMYASSPSLTALEHPIYDVTMVDCAMKTEPKDALDDDAATAKKSKKKAG